MSRLWVAPLLVGLAACSNAPVVELGAIPGTASVQYDSGKEGTARVVYTLEGSEVEQVSPYGPAGSEHTLRLLGLRTSQTYEVAVEVDVDGTVSRSPSVTVEVPPPPAGVRDAVFEREVLLSNPDLMCDPGGYVLFSFISADETGVGILDRDGKYVWAHVNDVEHASIGRPRPGRDGTSIIWNYADEEREVDRGGMVRLSIDGAERTETRALWAHHDFVELPDEETFAFNGYCFDESVLFQNPATKLDEPLAGETVNWVAEGAAQPDESDVAWNMCDPKDWSYGYTATNFNFLPGFMEYGHGNSIAYLPEQDAYLVMFRWIDTIVKINGDGTLAWVWGGDNNQLTAVKGAAPQSSGTDNDLFLQGHFSDAWVDDDGNIQILIFDNRPRGNNSRLKQFTINETEMTYALDWGYQSDAYENLLGDVRRMPIEGCDNLLVSFSNQGRIVELTRDGEIAWEVGALQGSVTTRVHYLPTLYDMSGFAYP